MADKCLIRIESLLKKSSIRSSTKEEIINAIKIAQAEAKLTSIDEVNVDKIAKDVSEQIKAQKKIDKRNAIENEVKNRKLTEFVLKNLVGVFQGNLGCYKIILKIFYKIYYKDQ